MSVVFTLTSAAILAGVTLSTATTVAVIDQVSDGVMDINEPIETMFNDCELLEKTLLAHGCGVKVLSENHIVVETQCGNMRYVRKDASLPFGLLLNEISNPDELFDNLKSFEVDYGRNVQAYTYNHIKENLADGMSIGEEVVMEDDSLYLTINVDQRGCYNSNQSTQKSTSMLVNLYDYMANGDSTDMAYINSQAKVIVNELINFSTSIVESDCKDIRKRITNKTAPRNPQSCFVYL